MSNVLYPNRQPALYAAMHWVEPYPDNYIIHWDRENAEYCVFHKQSGIQRASFKVAGVIMPNINQPRTPHMRAPTIFKFERLVTALHDYQMSRLTEKLSNGECPWYDEKPVID